MITLHASEFHLVPPGQISDDESGCDCGLRFDRGWGEWRVRLWILSGVLLAAIVVAGWAMLEREHQTKWLAAYHEASDSFDRYNYTIAEGQIRAILPQAEKWWPNGRQLADSLNLLALIYDAENRPKDAEPMSERAIGIFEKQSPLPEMDLAKAYSNEGNIFMHEGRPADAEHRFNEALAIYRKDPAGAGPELGSVLHSLGVLRAVTGQIAQAQPLLEEAVKVYEQTLPPVNSDLAQGYLDLAADYRVQGHIQDADGLDRKALAIQQQLYGKDSATVRQTDSRIGTNPAAAAPAAKSHGTATQPPAKSPATN
jgi:tetratricopeptide (TPR) repeat protein